MLLLTEILQSQGYNLASDGIYEPSTPIQHREDEYEESGFETLFKMQEHHFWYRGRHRFLHAALKRYVPAGRPPWAVVDLGGGVGGWIRYLHDRQGMQLNPLALADSSRTALRMAVDVLPSRIQRFQVDLMNLGWQEQWDITFLLDVIEHLPDDLRALREAREAMKPGGLLFVTTPALRQFWSYNDDLAHHLRRYTRKDFVGIAKQAGFELCDARYFMFFLSPLYWFARRRPGIAAMTEEQKRELVIRAHQIPSLPINTVLTAVFGAETPLGYWLRFPWGTSILGIFRKPTR